MLSGIERKQRKKKNTGWGEEIFGGRSVLIVMIIVTDYEVINISTYKIPYRNLLCMKYSFKNAVSFKVIRQ